MAKDRPTAIITISNLHKPETNAVLSRIVIALRAAGLDPVVDHGNRFDLNKYLKQHNGLAGPIPDFMEKVFVEVK